MHLIERYLQAVKFWLPQAQQEDIAAELHANILASAEDREAELGRALEENEEVALLKKFGPPPLVAARYRQDQGTVAFGPEIIGPLLYPYYRAAVKATLGLLALWQFLNVFTLVLAGRKNFTQAALQSLWGVFDLALLPLILVTIIFAALDRILQQNHFAERWDPRSLPPLHEKKAIVPRANSIAGLIVNIIFLLCWLNLPELSQTSLGPIRLAPIWATLYQPILLITVVMILQNAVSLARPNWNCLPPLVGCITSICTLAVSFPLIDAANLIVVEASEPSKLSALRILKMNQVLHYAVLIVWICVLVHALVEAVQCVRLARNVIARPVAKRTVSLP